jgi:U3 small nucleolar RNA-associated protein 22
MSILTTSDAGRATKRRKLSASPEAAILPRPTPSSADSELEASEVSSSDEEDDRSILASRKSKAGHGKHANTNGLSNLPNGGLNRTSMLALQVNELLAETRSNYEKLESRLETTVQRITGLIKKIPVRPPALLRNAEKILKADSDVRIPFFNPRPSQESNYKFEYQAPERIDYLGSVALRFGEKSSSTNTVTIAVQMPESLFQEKDYLNHRAFYRRAFYLACIAAGLKNAANDEFELHFQVKDDLELIPVVIVSATGSSPRGFQQSKAEIEITVTFPATSIPVEKTHPGSNCLREGGNTAPTPMYSSCGRSLASLQDLQQMIHSSVKSCESFTDTSRLASIWLKQRDMGSSCSKGGFGIEEWTLLCALLLQTGGHNGQPLISNRYTTVQLFKAVLQFLAVKDLTSPMIVRSSVQLARTDYPVLYDGATGVNLFFKMTPWSYQALREEASLTLAAINARNEDNFDSVFVVRASDPLRKFDELYQIESPSAATPQKVFDILIQGFGDRVKRISINIPSSRPWQVTEAKRTASSAKLNVGLVLAPENKDRLVDHGPPAENHEDAVKFRAFWGEKAELRRFKDGSIVESLVWSEDEPVTFQVIKYLVKKHFGLQASSVFSFANQVDSLMLNHQNKLKPTDAFKLLNNAYQTLTTQLHNLEELPLRIRSITAADSQLSSSSLITPLSYIQSPPANIYIEFENSTRWPDHLPAIQHTKIAFLLKLGEVLQAAHPEYSTRVGLENTRSTSSGHENTSYLDIILPTSTLTLPPLSFRLRITHDREITLIEKLLSSKTLTQPSQTTMTTALLAHRRILAHQHHTTALRTLTTRFPALSQTIRLLKKWTASHLLPPTLLPDPLLDLLAIHTFTSPYPYTQPTTSQTAFLRTLHTLSRWDWASSPLLIDTTLDGSLFNSSSSSDLSNLRTRFAAWRKLDPHMSNVVLFVGTNLDNTGVVWTQGQQPPRVLAGRLTALAGASVALLQKKGLHLLQEEDWRGLFRSPVGDFDFLIHLKRGLGKGEERKGKGSSGRFKNLQLQEGMEADAVGFDPVMEFVEDLESTFEGSMLLFYDRDGGTLIAGLWNPRVLKSQDFRVRLGASSMPMPVAEATNAGGEDEKEQVVINQSGILAEVAMMGEGLVQRIEVVKDFV